MSKLLPALLCVEALLASGLAVFGAGGRTGGAGPSAHATRRHNRALVAELQLTDLALWSGSSYCRHPSQTDLFAPFSDHPAALEHFPAGSLVPPPAPGDAGAGREVPPPEP
ncbi:MAG: hypothetical protein PVG07_13915 [Acidobacteriota bacterium]|jgi:hypothetical protein